MARTKKLKLSDKKLIKQLLQTAITLIDKKEITDFYQLGLVAGHLEFLAASGQGGDREPFTYGQNGDVQMPDIAEKLQAGCDESLVDMFDETIPDREKWWFRHLFAHLYGEENAIPEMKVSDLLADMNDIVAKFPKHEPAAV